MAAAQAQKQSAPVPPSDEGATPLLAQYLAVKARHADCLLFFRLGDFYEMFFEDAVIASKALDIALTRRGQHQGQDVPMCGVPAHSYESYLARLIRQGHRVALCEQTETPDDAKKRGGKSIVTRDVVRIVTPGTVTEDTLLDARAANYLLCLAGVGEEFAAAWLDLAAAQPCAQAVTLDGIGGALARLDPSEILIAQRLIEHPDLFETLAPWRDRLVPQPNGRFDSDNARRRLHALYNVNDMAAFGDFSRAEVTALGALLDYVALTQKSDLTHLANPQRLSAGQGMAIDPATRRNLELTRTLAGERKGSLLATIDRTLTGAGARMLAAWLAAPLTDVAAIQGRLDAVECLVAQKTLREALREALRQTPDLERAVTRLALMRGGPRDLAAVRDALRQAEHIRSALLAAQSPPDVLQQAAKDLGQHNSLVDRLSQALAEDLPFLARDGHFIARGFAPALDELVMLRDDSRRLIAGLQQTYAETSGVAGLKIRHNNVIGYYIEVTPLHADKLLGRKDLFIHRQSLASAARFTTVELGELERKITEAADKALAMEMQLFADLVQDVVAYLPDLRRAAAALAFVDTVAGLAELAVERHYTRPKVDESLAFAIIGGRHPVVEQALKSQASGASFIANACDLAPDQRLWLLTGPNMAGKSTFLRQNALIAVLAQTGSFVPADSAHIGIVDRLFSRVGASDDLARGHSTFMVEMVETAAILNQAGERALVILDEIGRGTATYDGLSIAWATMEHLHNVNQCRALFATHYHELTALTASLPNLRCHTMRIKEWEKDIIFLHEVIAGTADRSYGIHVARMAGLPAPVIARAEMVLQGFERGAASPALSDTRHATGVNPVAGVATSRNGRSKAVAENLPLFAPQPSPAPVFVRTEAEDCLNSLKPDDLTPKQALDALYRLKSLIDGKKTQ